MKIHIVGLGYTGLTLAVTLADVGFTVYGSDVNDEILESLNSGGSHIFEKNLPTHLKKHINKTLFVSRPEDIPKDIGAHIVCVHTPIDENKKPNLEAVRLAFNHIAENMKRGQLVILRSTVPVGTTRNFVKPILEKNGMVAGRDFYLTYAPERTTQGDALRELKTLPQIIGGINDESINQTIKIFIKVTPTITSVDNLETAELIKLIDNSYRDLNFAYAQEISNYCKKIGLNAFDVIKAANQHYPRNRIPVPSPGIGGICLNKDPHILLYVAKQSGEELKLVRQAREINEATPKTIFEELKRNVGFNNKKILIAGFAFKGSPETNDVRESPTLQLLKHLSNENCKILGYDPVVESWKIKNLGADCVESLEEGIKEADMAIFMTNHKKFEDINTAEFFSKMKKGAVVFDGWGMFRKKDIEGLGLVYKGVGVG